MVKKSTISKNIYLFAVIFISFLIFPTLNSFAKEILVNGTSAGVEISVLQTSANSTILEYTFGGYNSEEILIAGKTYITLSVPDMVWMMDQGFPQVPIGKNSIIISDYDAVNFKIIDEEYMTESTIPVAPSKGHFTRDIDPDSIPYTFDEFYNKDAWYPSEVISLSSPYIMRDFRGVTIQFNPMRFNPVRGEMTICKRLVVEVFNDYSQQPVNTLNRISNNIAQEFEPIYKDLFLNYTQRSTEYTPLPELGRLLIVYHSNYASKVTPFYNWKVSQGFNTLTAEYPTVTGSGSAALKTYIQNLYNEAQSLMFIILIGESNEIPTINGTSESAPSDPCYVKLAGTDAYPDAYISRISPTSATNCEYILNKIITYQSSATNGAAEDSGLFSGTGVASNESGSTPLKDWERMNLLRTMLIDDMGFATVDQIYDPGATSAQVAAAINAGRSMVNYIGHGSGTSWSTTGFGVSNIHNLTNGNMNPFIIDVACQNGDFTRTECMEEAWIRAGDAANPKGAIAVYGASTNASWVPPCDLQNHAIKLMTTYQKMTVGGICFNGLMHAMDLWGGSSGEGLKLMEQYNIFGDCSTMLIFTTPPDDIAPTQVNDLDAGDITSTSITLTWTAPMDASTGGVAGYDIRYSLNPINDDDDFNNAQSMLLTGQNDVQGTPKSFSCTGLDFSTTYYFTLKAFDAFGNTSLLSNPVSEGTWGAPQMDVTPELVNVSLPVNSTYIDSILISNTTAYSSTLDYEVELTNNTFPTEMFRVNLKPISINNSNESSTKGIESPNRGQSFRGSGGPDNFGYQWIDSNDPAGPTYVWNDISTTGTAATQWTATGTYSAKDEGYSGPFNLGFGLKFYGITYNQIYVSANGTILFAALTSGDMSNAAIPNSSAPNNFIAPFWDDLDGSNQGTVHYQQIGNKFIVQFTNWQKYNATSSLTFQVEINSSGKIMFYYKTLTGTLTNATVGIENSDGTDGLQIVRDAAYLANNLAIQISADPEWLIADIPEGTLYNGSSAAIELEFITTDLIEGQYSMDVVITGNDPAESVITVPVTLTVGIMSTECQVNTGWNIISVPLNCTCMDVDSLYPNAVSDAFLYDGAYNSAEVLQNGTGYWLKFDASESINISGSAVTQNIPVEAGWNIIGPFHQSVAITDITSVPEGIIESDFFGYDGAYNTADTLQCGKGYWIKTSAAGELNFKNLRKVTSDNSQKTEDILSGIIEAPISVSDGISATKISLAAGINPEATNGLDISLGESELPPIAPSGLDARFVFNEANNYSSSYRDYKNCSLGSAGVFTYTLNYRLTNGSKGLILNFTIPTGLSMNIQDLTGGKLINQNFAAGENHFVNPLTTALSGLKITLKYDGTIFNNGLAKTEILPEEYILDQNYPNPFNPTTTIKYALPFESSVRLEIYNTLGQRIAELVNENQSAGYYEVKFDAANISSGIYFYVMTAESMKDTNQFRTVKKMLMVK
ncbi:MAG: C25 family cysteine peptidase [bacterium]